jgi:hypothetical protein
LKEEGEGRRGEEEEEGRGGRRGEDIVIIC